MPSWSEVLGNGSIGRQKTLGMAERFEPLHATLPLARRPMRILRFHRIEWKKLNPLILLRLFCATETI